MFIDQAVDWRNPQMTIQIYLAEHEGSRKAANDDLTLAASVLDPLTAGHKRDGRRHRWLIDWLVDRLIGR